MNKMYSIEAMIGKVVEVAIKGKDKFDYDYLIIKFTDHTVYNVIEHSQTGEIKQFWT